MEAIEIQFESGALPTDARALRVVGEEQVNALSRWSLELMTNEVVDLEGALGAVVTLHLADSGEAGARSIGLIVSHIEHVAEDGDGDRYVVELVPSEWLLTLRGGYRIFLRKSTQEIVSKVLEEAGIPADQQVFRLAGSYPVRDQCVQYGETEWAFVERLLADDGVSYFFDFKDGKPIIVFADDAGSHDTIEAPVQVPFDDGGLLVARSFAAMEVSEQVVPTKVHLRDYDVRHPDVFIEGTSGDGTREVFEYPAFVPDEDAAKERARVRVEQLSRFRQRIEARGSCTRVQPGRLLDVVGLIDEGMNRKYLVVSVRHTWTASAVRRDGAAPYHNEVVMVPGGEKAFRPEPPATRPRVEGIEVGMTTGASGSEIHVNDLGELKIRLPWDRSGIGDDTSSIWVRNMQNQMGGSMVLPRVGWEVPVAYLDGNPDRPLVLGRIYNAESIVPYGLPGKAATSTFQSATSPGGGSTNEIRMGDTGGSQEMFVHASKDQSVSVGGSQTTKVGVNETHDIGLSLKTIIGGSQSHTVSASQSVNVATDYSTTLDGSRSETVGGLEMNKVTGNRVVDVKGAYTELVGGLFGMQCNQENIDVKGAFLQMVGGSYAQGAGLGWSESVAGARGEKVSGSKNITAASGYSEKIIGVKNITAGATSAKAGGKVNTASKTSSGTINVGGSADLKAGGPFVITSDQITIEVAGSLKAEALQIAGGTLKPKKGKAKVEGTIKRQGGTKIE